MAEPGTSVSRLTPHLPPAKVCMLRCHSCSESRLSTSSRCAPVQGVKVHQLCPAPAEVKPERLSLLQASALCVTLGPFQDLGNSRWVVLILLGETCLL